MSSNESTSVPARLKDLKDSVKERFLGLLGIRQPKVLLEDEQEVFLQVGRTVWHAPRQLRIELWLSSLARRHSLVSEYHTYLSQEIAREASSDIEKDVHRTFPNTRRFHSEEGQAQLRNVLRAYASYDPDVAYCQGMNFLTGLLLMYMPTEAHAFAALVVLMEDRKLRSFYHRSMSLLQVQLWQLSRLISPALNQHLEALGVVPMLYGASWLMTAFSADFPIPFSARIMDVLLADQCECALLKVAVTIMKVVGPRLHAMTDLEAVLGYLKIEVPGWEEPKLHDLLIAAFTKPWTARQLSILRSTEGAETVAQAMDRVMNMNEQLSAQTFEDDEASEFVNGSGDARVAVAIPRLQPPPQPSSSFAVSPACGTPINGGMYGTGSHGGAANGSPRSLPPPPPPPPPQPPPQPPVMVVEGNGGGDKGGGGGGDGSSSCSAAAAVLADMSSASNCGVSGGKGSVGLLQGISSVSSSPATWGIPCIHPNVPASPAIQAFRRAHLPSFQAVTAAANSLLGTDGIPVAPHRSVRRSSSCGGIGGVGGGLMRYSSGGMDAISGAAAAAVDADGESPRGSGGASSTRRGSEGYSAEEWGEFNAAAVRQQWWSVVRAAPGLTRHVLSYPEDLHSSGGVSTFAVATGGSVSGVSSNGGALAAPQTWASATVSRDSSSGSATQPIPMPYGRGVPSASTAVIGSAFAADAEVAAAAVVSGGGASSNSVWTAAAAATAIGKPPLPPRCTSLERSAADGTSQLAGLYSRLSVVAEDPLVQVGSVAPAPSPRGSMDIFAMMGLCSQSLMDVCEQHGRLLSRSSFGGGGDVATGDVVLCGGGSAVAPCGADGTASYNGDYVSGTASATTGCVLLSPAAISGTVSPFGLGSPRVLVGWSSASMNSANGGVGGATGGDAMISAGYMPLDLERVLSGSSLDHVSGCSGGCGGSSTASLGPNRTYSLVSPVAVAASPLRALQPLVVAASTAVMDPSPFVSSSPSRTQLLLPQAELYEAPLLQQQQQQADMATDIAGDILRMLSAVDTGNAHAAYDPRVILGESMYADSPNKEEHQLVRTESETLRHLPSSSLLAEIAAQDLAKAQEEAERVRLELDAQLQQQRAASERQPVCGFRSLDAAWAASSAVAAAAMVAAAAADATAASGFAQVPGDETAAEAADVTATSGGGADEVIFKRPKLYVDGIPMFDPKSLMMDSHETQAMFTPTVSPGASSYLEALTGGGFTPTGDGSTPTERDAATAAGSVVTVTASVVTVGDKGDLRDGSAARPMECGEESGVVMSTAECGYSLETHSDGGTLPGTPLAPQPEAKMAGAASAQDTAACLMEIPLPPNAAELSRSAVASAAAEAAAACSPTGSSVMIAVREEQDDGRSMSAAAEWVDWSQAPPVHVGAAVALQLPDLSGTSGFVVPSGAAAALELVAPQPSSLPPSSAAAPPPPPPLASSDVSPGMTPQGPMVQSYHTDHDVMDGALPATPVVPPSVTFPPPDTTLGVSESVAIESSSDRASSSPSPCTGTRQSLEPYAVTPQGVLHAMSASCHSSASFSDLANAASSGCDDTQHASSSSAARPYGLLSMTSTSSSYIPPMTSALSYASTSVESLSACRSGSSPGAKMLPNGPRSASVGGLLRTHTHHLQALPHLNSESQGVNMRFGSYGGLLYGIDGRGEEDVLYGKDGRGEGGVLYGKDGRSEGNGPSAGGGGQQASSPTLSGPVSSPADLLHSPQPLPATAPSCPSRGIVSSSVAPSWAQVKTVSRQMGDVGAEAATGPIASAAAVVQRAPDKSISGLVVTAEVVVSESSLPEPDAMMCQLPTVLEPSVRWGSTSPLVRAAVGGGGGTAMTRNSSIGGGWQDPRTVNGQGDVIPVNQSDHSLPGSDSDDDPKLEEEEVEEEMVKTPGPSVGSGGSAGWSLSDLRQTSMLRTSAGGLEVTEALPEWEPPTFIHPLLNNDEVGDAVPPAVAAAVEVEMEQFPYRNNAALSPSLMDHIMSAYRRSEQHQQQQEQRELQERMAQQQKQEQQQHQAQTTTTVTSCTMSGVQDMMLVSGDIVAPLPQQPPPTASSSSAFGAVVAHLVVVEELSGFGGIPTTTMGKTSASSGLASPALASPGRPSGAHGASYSTAVSQPSYIVQQVMSKALTPFALSLEDISISHISTELLQCMPPPPPSLLAPAQPDTPTPLTQLQLVSRGCGIIPDHCRAQLGSIAGGHTSLRCTGSGEGDVLPMGSGLSDTSVSMMAVSDGSAGAGTRPVTMGPTGRNSDSGANLGVAVMIGVGALDCGGTSAGSALVAAGTSATLPQPLSGQAACGMRSIGASGGGSVMPLIRPPPPPLVPLCSMATARGVEVAAGTQPVAWPQASLQVSAVPPVLCSSSATVVCVTEGDVGGGGATVTCVTDGDGSGGATTAVACTPVTAAAAAGDSSCMKTVPLAAVPPIWTATFDGVDDTPVRDVITSVPTVAAACTMATATCTKPSPRALSSAFAAEADIPPFAGRYDSGGGGGAATMAFIATTTGVSTPEARVYKPDMARGMSLEVAVATATVVPIDSEGTALGSPS